MYPPRRTYRRLNIRTKQLSTRIPPIGGSDGAFDLFLDYRMSKLNYNLYEPPPGHASEPSVEDTLGVHRISPGVKGHLPMRFYLVSGSINFLKTAPNKSRKSPE